MSDSVKDDVYFSFLDFFFSSRRRHTRCALVTGVQTCALPIFGLPPLAFAAMHKSIDLPPPPPLAELAARNPLALFLDFDGTLVEIADTPDGIHVPDGLPAQLVALRRALDGRIAIVSGRAIADIQSWLGPSDLLMVGSHGAEIGEPATGAAILSDASRAALAALTAAWPRLLVETKPHGIAVPYRDRKSTRLNSSHI